MTKFVSILLVVAFLIVFFNGGDPEVSSAEEFFDKLDVAYYKLSVPMIDYYADIQDDNESLSVLKSIFRVIMISLNTPQYVVDIVLSTQFLFTAKPVDLQVFRAGNRKFLYSDAYGWLVCPSSETILNKYYSARFPDAVFTFNPTTKSFYVDGQTPVIGGGTR